MIPLLRHIFVQDFWLKLFSFALAVLIWFIVNIALQKEVIPRQSLTLSLPERVVFSNLPVVILSSAEDVRSMHVNPKEVEVTVEGDPKLIKQLQGKDIRVLVDLTGIEAAHDLRKRIEVTAPAGITLDKVVPDEVQVIFPAKGESAGS
ncbi:MAG TPA: CdaR family protein [Verrucomicrobiae bacterium]|nr:CdaR family protein [Verrucomicrobiae bacterium]